MAPTPDPSDERVTNRYHLMRAAIYRILSDHDAPGAAYLLGGTGPSGGAPHPVSFLHGTAPAASPNPPPALPPRTTNPVVLIVDDEEDIIETLRDCIQEEFPSVRVFTATSGTDALKLIQTQRIDLIITDYKMPSMDGFEFLTQAERLLPLVPRILITGYAVDVPSVSTELFHVRHFFSKPFTKADIAQAVHQELDPPR